MVGVGKGVFEVELSDKTKVGFKFGMYASRVTEEVSGVSISQLFNDMKEGRGAVRTLFNYFYGGAVAYNEKNGLGKISEVDLADQLEEIGFDKMMQIYTDSLKAPEIKNQEPPQKTGATTE